VGSFNVGTAAGPKPLEDIWASAEPFFFDREGLARLGLRLRRSYLAAEPFPHVVFDDFLPPAVCEAMIEEFPGLEDVRWKRHVHLYSDKLACGDETEFGPVTRQVIAQMNSGPFIEFLESVTAVEGLVPDPHLYGGGLHCIPRGGLLEIHADFNVYERLSLDRRLNLLLYLNRDWREEWGGHLELWNRGMTRAQRRIAPVANRVVLFSTTDTAFHGHPLPLDCPPERTRQSLALYYYTSPRSGEETSPAHSTLYQRRPGARPRLLRTAKSVVKRVLLPLLAGLGEFF
jgi:2-oxoglutarate-Fe(II)-dependent oxygenase superfamily protein